MPASPVDEERSARIAAHAARVAEAFPPLSDEQRARVARLLRSGGDTR